MIVTVVAAAPAVTLEGEIEVTVGLGFDAGGGGGVVVFIDPLPPPHAASVNAIVTINKKTHRRLGANRNSVKFIVGVSLERKEQRV